MIQDEFLTDPRLEREQIFITSAGASWTDFAGALASKVVVIFGVGGIGATWWSKWHKPGSDTLREWTTIGPQKNFCERISKSPFLRQQGLTVLIRDSATIPGVSRHKTIRQDRAADQLR